MQGAGFRVQGSGFMVQGSRFWVQGSGFRIRGSGFRVQGVGLRSMGGRCPAVPVYDRMTSTPKHRVHNILAYIAGTAGGLNSKSSAVPLCVSVLRITHGILKLRAVPIDTVLRHIVFVYH